MSTPLAKRKEPDKDTPPKKSGKKSKQQQHYVTYVSSNKDVGENAILCQWCNRWEHRVCANISVNEYDLLSNSCNKIMFFCSSCCPKVPLALKIDDLNCSVSSSYDNIHKAITELSTKIDNLLF